jgi:hypothetical protein
LLKSFEVLSATSGGVPLLPMLPITQSPGGYDADDHGQIWIEAQPPAAVSFLTLRTPCLGSWLGQWFAVNFSDKGCCFKDFADILGLVGEE